MQGLNRGRIVTFESLVASATANGMVCHRACTGLALTCSQKPCLARYLRPQENIFGHAILRDFCLHHSETIKSWQWEARPVPFLVEAVPGACSVLGEAGNDVRTNSTCAPSRRDGPCPPRTLSDQISSRCMMHAAWRRRHCL